MPHVISESGRALTAHHALLLLKVIDVGVAGGAAAARRSTTTTTRCCTRWSRTTRTITRSAAPSRARCSRSSTTRRFDKERARQLFNSGVLTLRGRAMAEQLYFAHHERDLAHRAAATATSTRTSCRTSTRRWSTATSATSRSSSRCPTAGRSTSSSRSCRSTGCDEEPTRRGTLQDVTCDSDGKIDRFVGDKNGRPSLELHAFRDGEDYILGIFLTGAYQEILGDLHNLFGDTNAVHIRLDATGQLRDHRPRARRHGDRGAELRAVRRVATCSRRSAAR